MMMQYTGLILIWGGTALVALLFLLWTYTSKGKKWLRNL